MKLQQTIIALVLVFLAPMVAGAADFLQVESSYIGDGWFQYRVKLEKDAYYEGAQIGALSVPCAGRTEYGVDPTDWSSNSSVADQAFWSFDTMQVQGRPYERTFLVRSSHTTFKTVDLSIQVTYVATPKTQLQTSQVTQIAGVMNLRGVIPCPPGEADASAVSFMEAVALRDDVRISSIVIENGVPTQLTYNWTFDSTVALEASFDLETWTHVATISGDAGMTQWDVTVPIQNLGQFYRLTLLANQKNP